MTNRSEWTLIQIHVGVAAELSLVFFCFLHTVLFGKLSLSGTCESLNSPYAKWRWRGMWLSTAGVPTNIRLLFDARKLWNISEK